MAELRGKVALVTGASRGLGVGIAEVLAEAGVSVALAARSMEPCQTLAARIESGGGQALALECDVSGYGAAHRAVEQAAARWGRLDILINNAGVIDPIGHLAESDPVAWSDAVRINLIGAYNMARAALAHLRADGGGVIVNISSGAAHGAMEGWSAYCAGKAGLAMLTRSLHLEEAQNGIRTFGFQPGTVDTDMQRKIRASGLNPVSQMLPEDHLPGLLPARAIAWLCSKAARDLSGEDLSIRDPEFRKRAGVKL